MLKLKTKTEFEFPTKRGTSTGIIHMIVEGLIIDNNNVIPNGYYYYYDKDNNPIKLDNIKHLELWDNVTLAEDEIDPMPSTTSLKENLLFRLKQFTFLQLTTESGQNYNTIASDWEEEL